jgi:hypothetical protein
MAGREQTNQEATRGVSAARRWAEYLLAVLGGNVVYLFMEPQLPMAMRHRIFRIDWGLALDFGICVALYGLVRLARGWNNGHD